MTHIPVILACTDARQRIELRGIDGTIHQVIDGIPRARDVIAALAKHCATGGDTLDVQLVGINLGEWNRRPGAHPARAVSMPVIEK